MKKNRIESFWGGGGVVEWKRNTLTMSYKYVGAG